MSVTTIARIQHRRGLKTDLPQNLEEGELGWCMDTRELFIGNSSAEGGNTQVLTANVDLGNQIRYQFVSSTQVPSVTGMSANQPVVRTLQQQLDDAWVNVRAFGAQGDGISDDTAAINRAMEDLYTKQLTQAENTSQTKKAIWFPSGVYVISDSLKLWPGIRLWGENPSNTKIQMASDAVVAQMVQLVDGLGQTDASIGDNGADVPQHIQVENLWFENQSMSDVVVLQRCDHVKFVNCVIQGSWQRGDGGLAVSHGVRIESLGSAVFTGNCEFVNCVIQNCTYGYYCEELVQNVQFITCTFSNLFKGVVTDTDGSGDGPSYTRVQNSTFTQIDDMGIQVMQLNPGVQSMGNLFTDVAETSVVEVIYWSTGTQLCTSVNDVFDRVSTPPNRIYNGEPTLNMVVNAQEPLNMPLP